MSFLLASLKYVTHKSKQTKQLCELLSDLIQGEEEFPYVKCTPSELAVSNKSETAVYLFYMTFRAASFGSCYLTTTVSYTC